MCSTELPQNITQRWGGGREGEGQGEGGREREGGGEKVTNGHTHGR